MAKCALYTPEQIGADKKPKEGEVGIDITDDTAIKRLLLEKADRLVDFQQKPNEKRDYKSLITKAVSQMNVSEKIKKELLSKDLTYTVLTNEKLQDTTDKLIDALGGYDAAYDAALNATDEEISPPLKVMIRGGYMQYYAELGEETTNEQERDMYRQKELSAIEGLDKYVRSLGTAINAVKLLYKNSEWGEANRWKSTINEANDKVKTDTKEAAEKIAKGVKKATQSFNEAADDVFNESEKTIADLKAENERLKQELKDKPKGGKNNPVQIFKERAAKAKGDIKDAYDLLMKPTKDALLPFEFGALTAVIQDMIEGGVVKAADVFTTLEATVNPKFAEGFEQAYLQAKENLSNRTDLDSAEDIAAAAENTANNIAKKIMANNAKIEAAKKDPSADLAGRIKKDADALNFPKTKKQQDVLAVMLKELQKKAKDFYKGDTKQAAKSGVELLNTAANNLADSKRIWDSAKGKVNEMIDADANYTPEQKAQLKEFLQAYQDSIFDSLLTKNKSLQIVKQALKEKGFVDAEGNVDWKSILGISNNTKAAKAAIAEWIKENTDLPQSEIQPIIDQIGLRYDAIVNDKIAAEISKLLKKNVSGKKVKPQIDKLVLLAEQGVLDSEAVQNILSNQFGIINLSADQQAEFDVLIKQYANAPIGFLKALAGENLEGFLMRAVYGPRLQGTWDYVKGEATLGMMNMPSVFTMRFYGLMTHVKNLAAVIDVVGKVLLNAIQTGDVRAIKAALKEAEFGWNAAKSVFQTGNIGTSGSAKMELNGVGQRYSVRTMEQLTKTKGLIPDYYVSIKDKTFNANILNTILRSEKYNPRLAEAADSFNWALVNASEQYKFLKWQARRDNPALSKRQAGDLAWEQMFGMDREKAIEQATNDFKKMGKVPTPAEFKRRVGEIQVQLRSEESRVVGETFADEVTYKLQTQTGIMGVAGYLATLLKSGLNFMLDKMNKDDKTRGYKVKQATISTATNSFLPFVNGVAQILERAIEFDPIYGTLKSAYYARKSFKEGNKISPDEVKQYVARQRAYEYITKAFIGLASQAMIIGLLALSAEDDEDETYITGSKTINNQKPNTLAIFGLKIPLELFGPFGISLGQFADVYNEIKAKKIETPEEKNFWQSVADDFGTSVTEAKNKPKYMLDLSFTQGLQRAANIIQGKESPDKYAANTASNFFLPYAGGARQLRNFIQPKNMERKGFFDELANSGGIYTNHALDKPALDYFGREYNRGERYNLTGDFSKGKEPLPIELALTKRYININRPLKDDIESLETTKYPLLTKDGKRVMDENELYEFRKLAGQAYMAYANDYYKKEKDFIEKGDVGKIKNDLSNIRSLSIEYAQEEMSKKAGAPFSTNKAIRRNLEKSKDKVKGSGYNPPEIKSILR
jgi:hypothetical protein